MVDRNKQFDRSILYRGYSKHKQWMGDEPIDHIDRYSRSMKRLDLSANANILEIGFGEGRFLNWARQSGHKVEGVEILPEMVERARAHGHTVYLGAVNQLVPAGERFDLIAAFDVIEHLTVPEILDLLQNADYLLKDRGKILLQFPNAGSPFSALYQTGDATHQVALSGSALEQISKTKGWIVTQCFNARVSSRHPIKQAKRWLAHRMRDCIEVIFSYAYYGARCPLDPNIMVVLERAESGRSVRGNATQARSGQ